MPKQRLFVVDKLSLKKWLEPTLRELFPQDDIQFFSIISFGIHQFDYPKGLKMHDFPYVGIPQLKEGGSADLLTKDLIKNTLSQADEIIFACTPDHTGAVAFYFMLVSFFGVEAAQKEYPVMNLEHYTPSAIKSAVENMGSTADEWFCEKLRYGVAKRYFEYNFHVNSMALLGLPLRHIGVDTQNYTMSKNSLQLLYFMEKQTSPLMFEPLMAHLSKWKGTGKYTSDNQPMRGLGCPASRVVILEDLVKHGLITLDGENYSISDKGRQFLKLLHPECYDLDLPYRLHQWCSEWNDSKPKIDRYLKTFFGRQKRFFGKIN